jgi:hypothetical protein
MNLSTTNHSSNNNHNDGSPVGESEPDLRNFRTTPKTSTVANILAFSKALQMVPAKGKRSVEIVLN